MKTYLDKLMKNKSFKEKFDKEYAELCTEEDFCCCNGTDGRENQELRDAIKRQYRTFWIKEMKTMLKGIKKQYKNDPQGLKLFTVGYKEMIEQLEEENAK